MCGDEYQDTTWDRKSKDDAVSLLASLATFDFIVSFLVLYEFLSHLSGVTVKQQGQSIDGDYQGISRGRYLNRSVILF